MESLSTHLSALHLGPWQGPAISALRIVLIAVAAWVAAAILNRGIRTLRIRVASHLDDREQVKRAETLGRVCRYIVSVVLSLIASVLILSELGVSIAPILGAAGVVGLAIGFGAQSLVKDYFNGFFLLLENQLTTGDVVAIAGTSGLVEDVTLRYVRLRDYDGNVHFVPNSLITMVTNMSRSYAHAVMDLGVGYREDTDEAVAVMRKVGAELREDAVFGPKILDDLDVAGVDRWDDSAVVLRCRFKVRPLEQWNVKREFLRRAKKAFDAADIEIPFPHMTIYAGVGKDGTAPSFPVRELPPAEATP
ncbi:MAG: mechanosensitive ion channel family protein [Proteobacteria bacterium]|nr:mechanosensitive ion channel family protein [Pseudomonadota bacterium]